MIFEKCPVKVINRVLKIMKIHHLVKRNKDVSKYLDDEIIIAGFLNYDNRVFNLIVSYFTPEILIKFFTNLDNHKRLNLNNKVLLKRFKLLNQQFDMKPYLNILLKFGFYNIKIIYHLIKHNQGENLFEINFNNMMNFNYNYNYLMLIKKILINSDNWRLIQETLLGDFERYSNLFTTNDNTCKYLYYNLLDLPKMDLEKLEFLISELKYTNIYLPLYYELFK